MRISLRPSALRYAVPRSASARALAGCAVGPNFHRPQAPKEAGYTVAPLPDKTTATPGPSGDAQQFVDGPGCGLPVVGGIRLCRASTPWSSGRSARIRRCARRRRRCARRRRWSTRSRVTSGRASARTTTSSGRSCRATPRPPRRPASRAMARSSFRVRRPSPSLTTSKPRS